MLTVIAAFVHTSWVRVSLTARLTVGHSWGVLKSIYNRGSQLGCFKVHLQSWVTVGLL